MNGLFLVLAMYWEFTRDFRRYVKGTGVSDAEDIKGKVVVITGANSGIGKSAAMEFAKRGATVVMGCRNLWKGQNALHEIKKLTGNNNLDLVRLDLADRESIKEFAVYVKNAYPEIKILLNNAGISDFNCEMRTSEGYSLVMMVNYFGHFLLTNLLLENLKNGSPSRIISVVSSFLMTQRLNLDDIPMKNRMPWYLRQGNMCYTNSKYALALFTKELGKRLQGTGVTTYSMCPCLVKTDFLDDEPSSLRCLFNCQLRTFGFSPDECAEEYISHLALSKSISEETGLMYRFRKPLDRVNEFLDDKVAEKLWQNTSEFLKIEDNSHLSDV